MLALALLLAAAFAVDPNRELIAFWPGADDSALRILKDIGVDVVITPAGGKAPAAAPLRVIAEIAPQKSLDDLAAAVAKAREAGYSGAVVSAAGDEKSFRKFLEGQNGFVQIVYLKPEELAWDVAPAVAAMQSGNWPGLRRASTSVASATERPWINTNQHLYAYLRALYPRRPALLSYRPEDAAARYDSVEVALAEAFATGGSVILSFPDDYRAALLKAQPRAVTASQSLARLAAYVKKRAAMHRPDNGSTLAVVAGGGKLEDVEEIINLSYRNNLSPQVLPSTQLPAPPAGKPRVLVAAVPVTPEMAREFNAYVSSGGIVVTAPPGEEKPRDWWTAAGAKRKESQSERDVFTLGKGTIYAYHEPILDPGAFALDLKDIAGLDNPRGFGLNGLDFRIWAAGSILATLHRTAPGQLTLVLTNYGSNHNGDFLIGLRGAFQSATIDEIGSDGPRPLPLMRREGRGESNMKGLKRVAVIVLQEK